jgi:hypothetical protein
MMAVPGRVETPSTRNGSGCHCGFKRRHNECCIKMPLQLAIGVPVTLFWVGWIGTHALAMRRERRYSDSWGALVLALFPALLSSLYLTTGGNVPVEVRNAVVGILGAIVGAVGAVWLAYLVCDWRANAQPPEGPPPVSDKSPPSPINAPNNSGIIAPNNSGTITQNQGPPRIPLGLYQNNQQVGIVAAFSLTPDGRQIVFSTPRIASGTVDFYASMEFQNFVVDCRNLAPPSRGTAAFTVAVVAGDVACPIVGKR